MSYEISLQKLEININLNKKTLKKLVNKAGNPYFPKIANNFTCALDFCLLVSARTYSDFAPTPDLKINFFNRIDLLAFPSWLKPLKDSFRVAYGLFTINLIQTTQV